MTSARVAAAGATVSLALVLQMSVFSHFSWHGVVPNLVLLVVVGAALVRGAEFGMVLGFAGGVLLDLVPPADHVAGRWALALLLVGYVAGRVSQDARLDARPTAKGRASLSPAYYAPPRTHAGGVAERSKDESSLPSRRRLAIARPGRRSLRPWTGSHALVVVAAVGASSFLGTSVFALSGVLLRDPPLAVADLLQVIAIAVLWDLLLTPLVLPAVMAMFVRLEPEHAT